MRPKIERIVVGGVVYRYALRAPKKDAFEQFLPKLERWHDKTLKMKQALWQIFYSQPELVASTLQKLIKDVDAVPYSKELKNLEKWAGMIGTAGMRLVDLENAAQRVVTNAGKWRKFLTDFSKGFHAEYEETNNPAYGKLAEAVDSFLEDLAKA